MSRIQKILLLLFVAITVSKGEESASVNYSQFKIILPRTSSMGNVSIGNGSNYESVFFNPALASDFKHISIALPGCGINLSDSYISLMNTLVENKDRFAKGDSTMTQEDIEYTQNLLRNYDTKWLGFNASLFDGALLYRGFGILFRQNFGVDFQANSGLLFPFLIAQYGQEREISLVFGHRFAKRVAIGIAGKLLLQQKKKISVALSSIGEIQDSLFWKLSDETIKKQFGLDLGLDINLPKNRHLSADMRNIGMTFSDQNFPNLSFGYGREIRENYVDSYSFLGEIVTGVELQNILTSDPVMSKLKLGAEIGFNLLPRNWLTLRLRSGLNGGYFTFGTNLQIIRFITIDYANYATESGTYFGQLPSREHVIYAKLHFNFNRKHKKNNQTKHKKVNKISE